MKHCYAHMLQTAARRRWTTFVAALAGACLTILSQRLFAQEITPPPMPTALQVPAGHRPFLLGHAMGTQNYICLPSSSGLAWVFVGPQATLFNNDKTQITTHFLSPNPDEGGMARPTWQHSRDTSTVWAKPIASYPDTDFVEPGEIPWLLLQVVGAVRVPTEGHRLTDTTYMQRVDTMGGGKPNTGCAEVGQRVFVPYTANYVFYKTTGRE